MVVGSSGAVGSAEELGTVPFEPLNAVPDTWRNEEGYVEPFGIGGPDVEAVAFE